MNINSSKKDIENASLLDSSHTEDSDSSLASKVELNKKYASKLGWSPSDFIAGSSSFDGKLVEAIKAFQENRAIPADGICGPNTFKRLRKNTGKEFHEETKDYPILFEGSNFVVCDYSTKLRKHENFPYGASKKSRYHSRPLSNITTCVLHHTAGNYLLFPDGLDATNDYIIDTRGWPRVPYHIYVPYNPPKTPSGKYMIFQLNPFDLYTWHTSGANDKGVGVVFQGSFSMSAGKAGSKNQPSVEQEELCLPLWNEYLKPTLKLEDRDLSGHCYYTKPACPGGFLKDFIRKISGRK